MQEWKAEQTRIKDEIVHHHEEEKNRRLEVIHEKQK
jgi:hypothetical protein